MLAPAIADPQLAVVPDLFEEAAAAFRQEKFEEAKAICEDLLQHQQRTDVLLLMGAPPEDAKSELPHTKLFTLFMGELYRSHGHVLF